LSRNIDSGALAPLNRAFRIAGAGSAQTELLDGELNQTIDVARVVRRSRLEYDSFYGLMRCEHEAGSLELEVEVDPYEPLAVAAPANQAPYPNVVPDGYDFWIFSASLRIDTDAVLTFASLSSIIPVAPLQGIAWGVENEDGTDIVNVGASTAGMALWNATVNVAGIFNGRNAESGQLSSSINRRLRRGERLTFRSEVTAAAVTTCAIHCGLFPTAMGQDAAF